MLALKLAWRNLFRNVRRTVLTCILITSALIVLILTDGLVLGMVDVMVSGLTNTLEGEAQVNRKGFRDNFDAEYTLDDPVTITDELARSPIVQGYAPRVLVGGMIASPYNTTGGLIYGVDATKELSVSRIHQAIYEGTYLTGKDRELLIGKGMADLLEVKLGDRIIVTTATVDENDITQELFRVTGFFKFGPKEMDETLAFINLEQAQNFLGMNDRLHQIAIRFHDPEDANRELPLYDKLTTHKVEAQGWRKLQPAMGPIIEMSLYVTAIVGVILFLLTSLGVVNSMFMSIYERIYEFGVAKAIGTTPAQVRQLVLYEAFFLALISCFFGILIGYGLSEYFATAGLYVGAEFEVSGVAFEDRMYSRPETYQFINFPIYVALLTVAAALYPANFASRIVPTQALQRAL